MSEDKQPAPAEGNEERYTAPILLCKKTDLQLHTDANSTNPTDENLMKTVVEEELTRLFGKSKAELIARAPLLEERNRELEKRVEELTAVLAEVMTQAGHHVGERIQERATQALTKV